MTKGYTEFLQESAGLTSLEVYNELRKRLPRVRTNFELLKRYIRDKHDLYYYELMMNGSREVSDASRGYLLALKEMCALIDACEYNTSHDKKGS